jgi:hypothetical protein
MGTLKTIAILIIMNATQFPFGKLHYFSRKADHARWHRMQSKRHILRSQLGFTDPPPARPKVCQGCIHYHGVAYGYTRENRTILVCGFHPYGWQESVSCPDWCGDHR